MSRVIHRMSVAFALLAVGLVAPATAAGPYPSVDGEFEGIGIRAAGSVTELLVAGRGGVPVDASAVVLNVTVTEAVGPGFVTVWPCGVSRPTASNLNFGLGSTVPNAVVAKVGVGGRVCVFVSNATHLVVDVNGFFPAGAEFTALSPARLLETRAGQVPTVDGVSSGTGVAAAGSVTELLVAGRGGVPVDASAVVLNVTVTEAVGPGFVTVWPCGVSRPTASNLNFGLGSTVPNAVVAKVGVGGRVCVFVSNATHLVVDVNGFFPAGAEFTALSPARLLETRAGQVPTVDGVSSGTGVAAAGSVTELLVAGRGGVPVDASAVVLNVTVTEAVGPGFVTVWPCGVSRPTASNLNFGLGSTVPNAVVAKVGVGGRVCVFVSNATHLVVDVNGFFPAGAEFTALSPARLLETRTSTIGPFETTVVLGIEAITEVSCPTAQHCVAVAQVVSTMADAGAILYSHDGARSWSVVSAGPDPKGFSALDCADANSCITFASYFGYGGAGPRQQARRSVDGGVTWTTLPVPADDVVIEGIDCASVTQCVAVGTRGFGAGATGVVFRTSDLGSTWSPATSATPVYKRSVSCPTTSVCFAAGSSVSSAAVVERSVDGGATWSVVNSNTDVAGWSDISCASTTYCTAVGEDYLEGPGVFAVSPRESKTVDGGTTWADAGIPSASTLKGISCASPGFCAAVGALVFGGGPTVAWTDQLFSSTSASAAWTPELASGGTRAGLNDISCPAVSVCVAVGVAPGGGRVYRAGT